MTYTKTFPNPFDPVADPEAVVTGAQVRFTVLTSRLLRLEYSPTGEFEDRPSQAFWMRKQPVPEYKIVVENGRYTLTTSHLQLDYIETDAGFSADTLTIILKESGETWQFGSEDSLNLLGTARTLDNIDGAMGLEEGLLSRTGYAVYDDTPRLVFKSDGWLEPRQAPEGYIDLYFFGYGQDADGCLQAFAQIAGPVPMVPRWALGNWWSRYWAYSAGELLGLMDEFLANQVPLSVCIVDMDWHITDTGNASSGWTGYTWNRDLFPDPSGFLAELHRRGLKTALNLHPADGFYPHEAKYAEMAEVMGIDPESKEPVPFDIADNTFTRAYFERVHHPMEADGVDFWWMDWQQGTLSGLPGLDPLWWLNHLHFYDLGRDGEKRPFIFSRWGGLGNHRYPIGFSGDTVITWDSLAFQPYFTATAANVNYGWWSHDIGGHMGGVEEAELFARWVQFGVLSPIFRLHCTNNPFHERRPWGWDAETERVTSAAMRLRHQLIPYIYTMAWRNHTQQLPLVRPMYHEFSAQEQAYQCPDQYLFGSELLAAPFNERMNQAVGLSRQVVWLPGGDWYQFFDGRCYAGDSWHALYGGLDETPLFARAGAMVPLAAEDGVNNPEEMVLHVFPGADNRFDLYEDDGLSSHSLTAIQQIWSAEVWSVTIRGAEGDLAHLPETRTWTICFRGMADGVDGENIEASLLDDLTSRYDAKTKTFSVTFIAVSPSETLTIKLINPQLVAEDAVLATCQKLVTAFRMETRDKQFLFNQLPALIQNPADLVQFELKLQPAQLRALAEVMTGAGYHRSSTRRSQDEMIILWNNQENEDVVYKLAALGLNGRSEHKHEPLPPFGFFTLGEQTLSFHEGSHPSEGKVTVAAWFDSLPNQLAALPSSQEDIVVQFEMTGENSRLAYILREEGEIKLIDGTHANADVTIAADAADWLLLLNGEAAPEMMFLEGKINITGNLEFVLQLAESINLSPPSTYQAAKWQLEVNYMDVVRLAVEN
jgi:alpha-glucosidase (family GH31 glycosyl hydrolase)/putative sterol carrier protein